MMIRSIPQAVTDESLFKELANWCASGGGKRTCTIRIISAFASEAGVQTLSALLDTFLRDGNKVEIIIGIDRNGTDIGALKALYDLQRVYPGQATCFVFNAPSGGEIFHPKLYIFSNEKMSVLLGSANLTMGGLGGNFESLIAYDEVNKRSKIAREAMKIWDIFANPKPPLRRKYLKPITKSYINRMKLKLPSKSRREKVQAAKRNKKLWISLSAVPRRRGVGARRPRPRSPKPTVSAGTYLLVDIMNETRYTQVQFPLNVFKEFWGVSQHADVTVNLGILTASGLTDPVERMIVNSGDGRMRRIEIPQIRNLARPLVALFRKIPGRRKFAFLLIPKGTKDHSVASKLLDKRGQQGGYPRRYVIGKVRDRNWTTVEKFLP